MHVIIFVYALFQYSGILLNQSWTGEQGVIGKGVSMINIAALFGQILSTGVGPVVGTTGDGNYAMLYITISLTMTFFIALFLRMPSSRTIRSLKDM